MEEQKNNKTNMIIDEWMENLPHLNEIVQSNNKPEETGIFFADTALISEITNVQSGSLNEDLYIKD